MLVDTPKARPGGRVKSLSLEQASALLAAAERTRMHAYISLCLATGIRTEEAGAALGARRLRQSGGQPTRAGQRGRVAIRTSHGDTKTEKSRRTLSCPRWG